MWTSSKYTFLLTLCFLFFNQTGWGQTGVIDQINKEPDRAATLAALERDADKSLARHDYAIAMFRYKQLINLDSLHVRALKGYGESAVLATELDSAEWAYQRLVDHNLGKREDKFLLKLADVQYRLGKYAQAKEAYMHFLAEGNVSKELKAEVEASLANCVWAESLPVDLDLKKMMQPLDTPTVNTDFSEFSPFPVGDTLYFSSYKFPFEKDSRYPKRRLIKVQTTTLKNGVYQTELVNIDNFNKENLHTAHVCFNEKGDVMYYTICRFTDIVDIQCELYRRRLQPDNTWGPEEKLPDYINAPGFTTTEPNVGRDPVTNSELLFFVSDRPTGLGKRDIWYSKITPDSLSQPVNLRQLNTSGEDVTPFYHSLTSILYFSTDGRRTLGGFDIYQSTGSPSQSWTAPANIGLPQNSGYNDVYYVQSPDGSGIYMASNRLGGFNTSEEGCCYDLYKAQLEIPKMIAIAFNKATGDSLSGTVMRLIELGPDNKVISDRPYTVTGPVQAFDLKPGKKYMIIGSKDRFTDDTVRFETPKTIWKKDIIQKLYLDPARIDLIVTVLDKETYAPVLSSKANFFDFGPVTHSVPVMTKTDVHPNDNRFDYNLEFDRKYKVRVSKPGFTPDSTALIATDVFKKSTTIRDTVYLTRAVTLKAHTLDFITGDTLYGVTYTLVDLTDNRVIDVFTSPFGKNFESTLVYEHRYKLVGSKPDYNSDSLIFTTLNLPRLDFQTIVRELILRPKNYLPITLFFDNDKPDKNYFRKDTTDQQYQKTYVNYINRKETFIEEYTKGMDGDELKSSTDSLDYFFEKQVRNGWKRLMAFSESLREVIEPGDTVIITIRGFASPRADSIYNRLLTGRRVASVRNHFNNFDDFKKAIGKQIFIVLEPKGESTAPEGISDDPKDLRMSIYDVRASRERRVEIVGVRVNDKDKKL